MKQIRHRLFCLISVGLLLCPVLPVTVHAQNEPGITEIEAQMEYPGSAGVTMPVRDVVNDLGELEAWLDDNPAGGAVTLGGDIEVTAYLELEQVTIDAKDFGFIVTGTLVLCGGVSITGGGAAALIRVESGGVLQIIGENGVIAAGEDGVALFFEAGGDYLSDDSARPVFRAEGTGSVAICSEIPLDLKRHTIQAADGAGLIESAEPVRLYLSRVEADGATSLPPSVTLDTCIVSPSVSGATVISRKISAVTTPMPLLLYLGELPPGFFANQKLLCNITLSAADVDDKSEKVYILFDDTGVDYGAPGAYTLLGTLLSPYDEFDMEAEACPIAITVTFYDPGIPYFYDFYKYGPVFMIGYYYSGDYDALTLWRSDDGGSSWRVYWKFGDADSENFAVGYDYESFYLIFSDPAELSAPALFVFEVGEGVGSDILYVDTQTVKSVGSGGDRDSGDRILLPWEFFFGSPEDNNDGDNPKPNTDGDNPKPNTDSENPAPDSDGKNPAPNTEGENPAPNTEGEKSAPEDEADSQGLDGSSGPGGSGGSDGVGGSGDNGDNGNRDGDTYHNPDTARQPVQNNRSGGDNATASITPVTAITGAIIPAGIAPPDTPSDMITSTVDADTGAPGESDPATVEHDDETTIAATVTDSISSEVTPEPISEPSAAPSPLYPILVAGLMGAGGLAYAFRKRRVKSLG